MKKVRRVWMARQADLTYNDAHLELQTTTRHDWIESKDRRPIDAFERKLSRPSSFFLLDDQERDWRAYSAACLFVENPCGRNARARKRLWLTIKPNNIRPSRGRKWRTRKWVTINGRRIKASVRVSTRQDNRTIASTILWDWSMPLKDQTSRVQRPLLLFINPSLLQGILVASLPTNYARNILVQNLYDFYFSWISIPSDFASKLKLEDEFISSQSTLSSSWIYS